MSSHLSRRLMSPRRRASRIFHLQAFLWSAGNALTSGTPIYFLAMELGGKNTAVGVLLALPTLLGVLRLAAPAVIARCGGDLRRACWILFGTSYLIAGVIPLIAIARAQRGFAPLFWLIAALCVHQTIEYLGLVALYSWLGEVIPTRIRGRYLGARQFWQLAAEIPVILVSGRLIDRWSAAFPEQKPAGYALAFAMGVFLLLASVLALRRIPVVKRRNVMPGERPSSALNWAQLWRPFRDADFRQLLIYGCWFSTFNGLTGSPQSTYPRKVLQLGLADMNDMRTAMRLGQFALSRPVGWACDRLGHRVVLIASQLLVAAAPLCFLLATSERWYWIAVAYLLWSWYVGLNVGLPSYALKVAPAGESPAYVATYFGVTGVCYAAASIAGGSVLDWLIARYGTAPLAAGWNIYHWTFLFAWASRTLGVVLLLRLHEPTSHSSDRSNIPL